MAVEFNDRGYFFEYLFDAKDLNSMGAVAFWCNKDGTSEVLENYEFPSVQHSTYDVHYIDHKNDVYAWLLPSCKHVPESWRGEFESIAFEFMDKAEAAHAKLVFRPKHVFYLVKATSLDAVWQKMYKKVVNNKIIMSMQPPSELKIVKPPAQQPRNKFKKQ